MHRRLIASLATAIALTSVHALAATALFHPAANPADRVIDATGRLLYMIDLDPRFLAGAASVAAPDVRARFDARHSDRAANGVAALERQYGFVHVGMTSHVGYSVSAYLTAQQLNAIENNPFVTLITEASRAKFSAPPPPPWADSANPQYPSETFSWGRNAVGGIAASTSMPRIYLVDGGVGYNSDISVQQLPVHTNVLGIGCYPHATHVAGIIAAHLNDGGTAGIVANATVISASVLMAVKYDANNNPVCDDPSGPGSLNTTGIGDAIDAVRYDIGMSRAVVNISMNGPDFAAGNTLASKIAQLAAPSAGYAGAVVVQAAGNQNGNACQYAYSSFNSPNASDGILVVGAIDSSGHRVSPADGGFANSPYAGNEPGSNYGPCVEVWAPGKDIKSTWGPLVGYDPNDSSTWQRADTQYTNHVNLSGTSMAAPHVTAIAAAIWQQQTGLTPAGVESQVRAALSTLPDSDPATQLPLNLAFNPVAYPSTGDTNVALASTGSVASASSTLGPAYPASSIIDNDRADLNPGNGGNWTDATPGSFPDWVEVDFPGMRTLDRVTVYSLQDDYNHAVEPTDTMTFTAYGITSFNVQAWDGNAWVTVASVTGNNLVKRNVSFTPYATNKIRIQITGSADGSSHVTEVEAWGITSSNVAAASNSSTAWASSQLGASYPVAAVIDGDRKAVNAGNGGNWTDGTANAYPDWVEVGFKKKYKVSTVNVFSLQDNYGSPVDPGNGLTFNYYGLIDFTVQGWDGNEWVTLGQVAGNNLVMRPVTFAPFTTDRVRVSITRGAYMYSPMTELEVWGVEPDVDSGVNVALAKLGSTVSASSTLSPAAAYPASSVIDGDRQDLTPGNGGNWTDGTPNTFPDTVEVDFPGVKTIRSVVVYALQDQYNTPVEPGASTTCSLYCLTALDVVAWNSSTLSWYPVGSYSGPVNLVRKEIKFGTPVVTDRIAVLVGGSFDGSSHIVELEAWGQ